MPQDIYVTRENIESEIDNFLSGKKFIWSIYGTGGIGKTILISRLYKQTELPTLLIDVDRHILNLPASALNILLYGLTYKNMSKFDRIRLITDNRYVSLAQKLKLISSAVGQVPAGSIGNLMSEFLKDDDFAKELGTIWRTIVDTVKVAGKLFSAESKQELVSRNPEYHLVNAILADFEKAKAGIVFVDTFEKAKDLPVLTTLRMIADDLVTVSEPYEMSFEDYLAMIFKFLYRNAEKSKIKIVIAGRSRVNSIGEFNLLNIKQTQVSRFEPEQVEEFFYQVGQISENFPLPDDEIISEITDLTKGNPLLLNWLVQFILVRYGDEWDWALWQELKREFEQSEEQFGLGYYLTDRIATHISGWENVLWRLAVPLEIHPEIANILFPKQENTEIYGKRFLDLLAEKGILRKGRRLDKNYYLHDELRAALEAYLQKHFGLEEKSPYDHPQVRELILQLRDFYDKKAGWKQQELNSELETFSEKTVNKELYLASYYAFAAYDKFSKHFRNIDIDRFTLWERLTQSVSITNALIRWIGDNFDKINKRTLKKILNFLKEELNLLHKRYGGEVTAYLMQLKLVGKLPYDWSNNYTFLKNLLEKFPNNAGILGLYAEFLEKQKQYDQAESYYKQALKIDPKNAKNLGKYAIFLEKVRKDYDTAEILYKRATHIEPKDKDIIANYASFLANIRKDYLTANLLYKDLEVNSLLSYIRF